MKEHGFLARYDMWLGCAAGALMVLTAVPLPALGAERMVLCEEFTQTGCLDCSAAGTALGMMLDNYPDTFTMVQIHVGDSHTYPWGTARATFYATALTPTAWFDGVDKHDNFGLTTQQYYDEYEAAYNTRRGVATDVTIELTGDSTGLPTYDATATVCIEAGGTGKTMDVYLVQVLDHWPSDEDYSRNGFKQEATVPPPPTPTVVTLAPDQCEDVSATFTLDADSMANLQDVRIVAWAQVEAESGPAEVYQAAYFPDTHTPIPTVTEWGIVAMVLLVLTAGTLVFVRRQRARA